MKYLPITEIAVETVRFDMQEMENPAIEGVEYQRGTLQGYELREYVLQKWNHTCAYCGAKDVPLELEHIIPKSKGGSDRQSNLALACVPCNQSKGNKPIAQYLSHDKKRLNRILSHVKAPLNDAAAVNATRYKIGDVLKEWSLPVTFWSGGRTKFNRAKQGYRKDHWIDAACVGTTGEDVFIDEKISVLNIKAMGRGSRQMCRMDKYGFPRTKAKKHKRVKGFQTGDMVKAVVKKGNKIGIYIGRVSVRTSGSFNIKTQSETVQGIGAKYCQLLHSIDGYQYHYKGGGVSSPT